MAGEPIEGQVLVLAAAKASIPPQRLPELLVRVQADLESRLESYRRSYERVYDGDDLEVFLVERDHWEGMGDRLGFDRRETAAVRRTHEEQLLRIGRRHDREAEFESALEIRDPVVIGTNDRSGSHRDR